MEDKTQIDDFLTVPELAKLLKVPISWVYQRSRERGEKAIPRIRCGRYVRFPKREVLEWLQAGRASHV
jgi:excisionase family DNA binding protein